MRALPRVLSLLFAGALNTDAQTRPQGRPEDAAAIRAHIESIFNALIDKDPPALARTHSSLRRV